MYYMRKVKLLIFFLLFLVFFSRIVYAQNISDWFGAWRQQISQWIGPTPEYLVNFLEGFGIPKEITADWRGIIFFIIIPILTFSLVLKGIMIDEVVVNMMGIRTFEGWKGWIFVLLIVLFLFPTGLVGMFAMWLYAAAGILVIYGFGALLIIGVITRLAPGIKGKWLGGLVLSIFALIFLSFINPGFAIIIGILGILMSLSSYRKTKYLKIGEPYKEEKRMGQDITMEISNIIETYRNKLSPTSYQSLQLEGKMIVRRAYEGELSQEEIDKIIKNFEKKVKTLAGLS